MTLAVRCAEVIATATVPAAARQAAARAVLDTVGVALAGSREPVTTAIAALIGDGPARLWGTDRSATLLDAALVNAVAAHALDYDDVHADVMGHVSAAVVPAVIAAAESRQAPGALVLDGYAVGLEVASAIGRALGPSHPRRGFHSSSTTGVFGAAAGCARVLGLNAATAATALSIAASLSSGLRANFGTMTKPLHMGTAARHGLQAALLARDGFTAASGALDDFLAAHSDDVDIPSTIGAGDWRVVDPGLAVKRYACCNRGHRSADAILGLLAEYDPAPEDVTQVEVQFPAGQVEPGGRVGPMRYPLPVTGLEGKFSLPYVVAAAVLDRRLDIAQFTDAAVGRPEARAFLPRVVVRSDASRATGSESDYVEVTMTLADGRRAARRVRYRRGDPAGGVLISDAELEAKFSACAATALPPERVAATLDRLRSLESSTDISLLIEGLTA